MKKIILLIMVHLTMIMATDFIITKGQLIVKDEAKETLKEVAPYTVIPGLYGFGTDTRAAYGGTVSPIILHVDTLKGTSNTDSTHGSFEWAVTQTYPRIIVFDVSGIIEGDKTNQLVITSPYITIAGQTAPGPVVINNAYTTFRTHDVLVQHVGFTGSTKASSTSLSVNTYGNHPVYNFVVDHCMICWGLDDSCDFWENTPKSINDITLSNNIYGEGIADGNINESKGLLFLGNRASIFGNLFHSNTHRAPHLSTYGNGSLSQYVVWNNLTYNYRERQAAVSVPDGSVVNGTLQLNYMGNETIEGPNSKLNVGYATQMLHTDYYDSQNTLLLHMSDNIKQKGTIVPGIDIWNGDKQKVDTGYIVDSNPLTIPNHIPYPASQTKATVLAGVGPWASNRGAISARFIDEVTNGTGSIKVTRPSMPSYTVINTPFVPVANPHDMYNTNYTNLEHQLHQLAAAVETSK